MMAFVARAFMAALQRLKGRHECMCHTYPMQHEQWCKDWGYEDCTCGLEERQEDWRTKNRAHDAAPLPVATLRRKR